MCSAESFHSQGISPLVTLWLHATVDPQADAVYLYFQEPGARASTYSREIVGTSHRADFDDGGQIIGVELLDVSRFLPPEFLARLMQIRFRVEDRIAEPDARLAVTEGAPERWWVEAIQGQDRPCVSCGARMDNDALVTVPVLTRGLRLYLCEPCASNLATELQRLISELLEKATMS